MTRRMNLVVAALVIESFGFISIRSATLASASPHPGQSVNVVIIGGTTLDATCSFAFNPTDANQMNSTGGGCLPVTGLLGELGDFAFSPLDPAAVNAASLAPFDTAVLNVASSAMGCNTSTLSATQRADLVAFVGAGKKLIVYDSECWPVDYTWLPFPFTTANPGAMGAYGTLTIVEENTLSSNNPLDPHFVDASDLSNNTDAVGDMNVMTTFDPNWCVDMSGTNAIGVTGPVHTYAKLPAGTDTGLLIYNGLDQDYQYQSYENPNLRKIWLQELQQPFNPSNLPCGVTVVGITLAPLSATNRVGQDHTVTATLTDLLGNPQPGTVVTFSVISGPNAGAGGTCSPNADCTTDGSGQVSLTYSDSGGAGTDEIQAYFTNQAGQLIPSQVVTKQWIQVCGDGVVDPGEECDDGNTNSGDGCSSTCTVENHDPVCSGAVAGPDVLWPPNHKYRKVAVGSVTDPDGDSVIIAITGITQDEALDALGDGHTCPDGAGVGTDTALVRAERGKLRGARRNGRVYHVSFTADDGRGGQCTGTVAVCVPPNKGSKGGTCVDEGPLFDSTGPCS